MDKKAVVFAGGGAKGSYQIGVWRALDEIGFKPDIITGTSVGSLNAAMMVQGDLALSEKLWISIDTSSVLDWGDSEPADRMARLGAFAREIARSGGVGYTPLKHMLITHIDEKLIRSSPVELGIVSVKYPSMQPVFMYTGDIPEGMLVDYLLASAACFPMMKAYEIDGQRYVDGGYYENLPINMALDHGADEIVAVDLQAIGRKQRPHRDLLRSAQLHTIKSDFDLGSLLIFDGETAKFNMKLGYLDALRALSRVEGVRFAFRNGTRAHLDAEFMPKLQKKLSELGILLDRAPRSSAERMARTSFARYARRHWDREMQADNTMLILAEAAGDVLGVDPLNIYTHESFAAALRQKREHPSVSALHKVESWLQNPEFSRARIQELAEATTQLRPQHAVAFTLQWLLQGAADDAQRLPQLLLCTLLPKEFAAALYLFAID